MKGFYIEITNNLLDPKHRKAMGESVWLFMWLLDKITSISEEGIGKVLGGKPIIYEEVNKDLNLPERTYRRWISILKKNNYINTKRAPTGLILSVNKAKKRFGRGVPKVAYQKNSDVPKSVEGCAKKDISDVPKKTYPNKTYTVDINKDINKEEGITPKEEMELFINSEEYFGRIFKVISDKTGIPDMIIEVELHKFRNYWTEKNGSGKKQKWEMEKTFELKRRLTTWFSNAKKFSQGSNQKGKTIYNTLEK